MLVSSFLHCFYSVLGIRTTDRIGVQNLQDLAKDMSSTFHGTLQHPSARDTQALKDYFPHMIALRNLVDSCMNKSVRHIPGKRFEIDLVRPPIVKEVKVKKGTSKKTQKGSTTKKTQPRPGRGNPQKEKPNASSVQPKKSTGKTEKGSSLSKGRPQKRNRVDNVPKQPPPTATPTKRSGTTSALGPQGSAAPGRWSPRGTKIGVPGQPREVFVATGKRKRS